MAAVEGGTKGGSGYFQAPRVSTRQRGEEGEGRIRLKDGRTGSGEPIWGGTRVGPDRAADRRGRDAETEQHSLTAPLVPETALRLFFSMGRPQGPEGMVSVDSRKMPFYTHASLLGGRL